MLVSQHEFFQRGRQPADDPVPVAAQVLGHLVPDVGLGVGHGFVQLLVGQAERAGHLEQDLGVRRLQVLVIDQFFEHLADGLAHHRLVRAAAHPGRAVAGTELAVADGVLDHPRLRHADRQLAGQPRPGVGRFHAAGGNAVDDVLLVHCVSPLRVGVRGRRVATGGRIAAHGTFGQPCAHGRAVVTRKSRKPQSGAVRAANPRSGPA